MNNLSFLPERFVVFDLETTGLDPKKHEIIEIGAIKVHRDSNLHDSFQALVTPTKRIPRQITEITGISQDMIDTDGEPLATVLEEFCAFIEDLPLVAFNAAFDMAFLKRAAKLYRLRIENRSSCALKLSRRAWPGRDSYRLTSLAADGGMSIKNAHRALDDCQLALIVYSAANAELVSRGKIRVAI